MTMRMKKLFSILAVAATVLLTACDEHQDFPDTAMKVTHILTTDGKVMPYETYEQSGKQAIAVVFNINQREEMEGNGYAVYLWDIVPEAFADSIGVKNDSKIIEPEEYWDSLSDIQYYMDEPVADPAAIALYFLSKEAAKKVKVVLSGEGSDELFGGYQIYCEPIEYTGFNKIPRPIRKALGVFAENCLPRGMKGRSFLIRHSKTLEERYIGNAYIFTEKEAGRLLKNSRRPDTMKVTAPIYERVKDKDPVTKMQYLDMHLWLVHDILMKGDKMGMANSLEVRVPFLDKEVMEVAQSLPLKYKIDAPRTKIALRAAADREIRSYTAEKKKLGFPIPIRVWLKEDQYYNRVRAMFETKEAEQFFDTAYLKKLLEEHRAGKFDNSRKIWTVYIFLLWYERFFANGKPVHPAMSNK